MKFGGNALDILGDGGSSVFLLFLFESVKQKGGGRHFQFLFRLQSYEMTSNLCLIQKMGSLAQKTKKRWQMCFRACSLFWCALDIAGWERVQFFSF